MEWISVNDERPEIAKQVIVFLVLDKNKKAGKSYAGFRANGGWYVQTIPNKSYVPNNDKRYTITHWMPLPVSQPSKGQTGTTPLSLKKFDSYINKLRLEKAERRDYSASKAFEIAIELAEKVSARAILEKDKKQ